MSSVLKKIGVLVFCFGLSAFGLLGCGTDPEEACEIICSKNAECQAGTSKDTCLTVCKKQAEDEATADALVEQSECYEDASCTEVESGVCVPQDL